MRKAELFVAQRIAGEAATKGGSESRNAVVSTWTARLPLGTVVDRVDQLSAHALAGVLAESVALLQRQRGHGEHELLHLRGAADRERRWRVRGGRKRAIMNCTPPKGGGMRGQMRLRAFSRRARRAAAALTRSSGSDERSRSGSILLSSCSDCAASTSCTSGGSLATASCGAHKGRPAQGLSPSGQMAHRLKSCRRQRMSVGDKVLPHLKHPLTACQLDDALRPRHREGGPRLVRRK